ncbi:Planctomycete cytochrome C [Stieleria neptunia]|uniref:Planctomycete cytochrome C n=1 Tax=Stieleria neptunia TaxID=2527979 RepID=A0A518HJ07_9BACT|nr:DUF1592 domain-containing protein [Stieleria neptunia]QDV40837.1 Planctomycete cytochrome C [Stieleria neptunia]
MHQPPPHRFAILLCSLVLLACGIAHAAEPQDVALDDDSVTKLIQQFCIDCHGPDTQEGELRLDTLAPNFTDSQTASKWIEVMDNLNLGEMPPQDERQPPDALVAQVVDWIGSELNHASTLSKGTGGRELMRRLNRREYANIVGDLLAVEFLPGEGPQELLPPDGTMNGFDTVSKALLLDPSLMDKYFEVAAMVANKAVITGPPPVPTRRNRMQYEDSTGGIEYIKRARDTITTENGIITMNQGMRSDEALRHPWNDQLIPIRGRYRLRVRLGADPRDREALYIRIKRSGDGDLYFGKVPGTLDRPEVIEIERAFDVPGGNEIGIDFVDAPKFGRVNYHFSDIRRSALAATEAGNASLAGRLQAQLGAQGFPNQGRIEPDTRTTDHLPRILFDWIELEGPLYDQWPPKSTERIFHRGLDESEFGESYAREIFARLLPRAFRRNVSAAEVDRIVGVVRSELQYGESFPDAIQSGIVAMLCSPSFLLIREAETSIRSDAPAINDGQADGDELNDDELAFRLSRFLWSTIPDDALRQAAASQTLTNTDVLRRQVRRMLKHEKADALVEGFARQWLKADEFDRFAIDQNLYREFYRAENAGLNEAINAEPIEFFREIMRSGGSLLDFLDSDWTMANETLARYYGIPGVTGDALVRVEFPQPSVRGGLSTMAALHKWGSDGNRTKPVERGKYILDVLFNDPPKPPPPNVGEVEPNVKGELLTVRQRLDQHRTIAACAHCHRSIDPYGLGLENFSVTGKWRTKQDGERPWWPDHAVIDASGTLPDGTRFTTINDYRAALRAQSDRFLRGFAEKMLTYALGRIIEPSDHATIDGLVDRMKSNGHSLHSLVEGIVLSDAFLKK